MLYCIFDIFHCLVSQQPELLTATQARVTARAPRPRPQRPWAARATASRMGSRDTTWASPARANRRRPPRWSPLARAGNHPPGLVGIPHGHAHADLLQALHLDLPQFLRFFRLNNHPPHRPRLLLPVRQLCQLPARHYQIPQCF